MPYSVVRFNCIQPGLEPTEMSARYQAFVDMAGYADEHGLNAISLEEHHGAENGWSPSPLVMTHSSSPSGPKNHATAAPLGGTSTSRL